MQIRVGHVLDDKYELVRLLGRGSMGQVWIAHHRTLGEQVAIKLLVPDAGGREIESEAVAAARFQFEAQVAARLSRKTRHIVRVTDHGQTDGIAYLVMELLDGKTLEDLLMHRDTLPRGEIVRVVAQIARALEEAHGEGVVHRDLKPANIFVTHDEDEEMLVKLLDFGIARAVPAQRVATTFATGKGLVFGTPGYMSPEQARASPELDERCDLWALATVAYEALTGELPVPGASTDELLMNLCAGVVRVRERDPKLPAALSSFFERAFAPRIEDRFATASELAEAFERAASGATPESVRRDDDATASRSVGGGGETALSATRAPIESPAPRRRRVTKPVLRVGAGAGAAIVGAAILAVGAASVALRASDRAANPTVAPQGGAATAPPARAAALSPTDTPAVRLEPPDEDAQARAVEDAQGPSVQRAVPRLPAKPFPAAGGEPRAPAPARPVAPRAVPSPTSPSAQKRLDKSEIL